MTESDSGNKQLYEDQESFSGMTLKIHIKLDHLRRTISETATETDIIEMERSACLLYEFQAK